MTIGVIIYLKQRYQVSHRKGKSYFYKLKKHNTYSSRYRPYGKCKSYFKITATDRANCL